MRGADKGTVVMIDGAPINMNETYFLDTFPVESIERVEIVKRSIICTLWFRGFWWCN